MIEHTTNMDSTQEVIEESFSEIEPEQEKGRSEKTIECIPSAYQAVQIELASWRSKIDENLRKSSKIIQTLRGPSMIKKKTKIIKRF